MPFWEPPGDMAMASCGNGNVAMGAVATGQDDCCCHGGIEIWEKTDQHVAAVHVAILHINSTI